MHSISTGSCVEDCRVSEPADPHVICHAISSEPQLLQKHLYIWLAAGCQQLQAWHQGSRSRV